MSAGLGTLRIVSAGVALMGLLAISGCSGSKPSASGGAVTVTVVQTPSDSPSSTFPNPGSSATDTGTPTEDSSPTDSGTSTEGPDPSASTSGPVVIGPGRQGVPLSLADFFEPDSGWSEGSENVADRKGLQGIFSQVDCSGNPDVLELRLEDNYKSLSFNVGQANNSRNVDQTLAVAVKANGKQVLVKNIPFNKLQNFTVPVAAVNALQIAFYLDPQNPNCGGSVVAVLYNAVLS
jgi:hypothetical protein